MTSNRNFSMTLLGAVLSSALLLGATPAQAERSASETSAQASALPVAVSLGLTAVALSAGIQLTVVAVEASADGTVWVFERASDGARWSVNTAANATLAIGQAVEVMAIQTGWVLMQGRRALCFVPNERGVGLHHHQAVGAK